MTKPEAIDRLGIYYREFHHKCITWYITVMGFFVAGLIAATRPLSPAVFVAILVVSSVLGLAFFICIFHYGARIAKLDHYLEQDDAKIPDNWREQHKKQGVSIKGAGSIFFFTILIIMQVAVWWLTLSKYP